MLLQLIESSYQQIEKMGYSRSAEAIGISFDELLATTQEHAIHSYWTHLEKINYLYLSAYGQEVKIKRKRT